MTSRVCSQIPEWMRRAWGAHCGSWGGWWVRKVGSNSGLTSRRFCIFNVVTAVPPSPPIILLIRSLLQTWVGALRTGRVGLPRPPGLLASVPGSAQLSRPARLRASSPALPSLGLLNQHPVSRSLARTWAPPTAEKGRATSSAKASPVPDARWAGGPWGPSEQARSAAPTRPQLAYLPIPHAGLGLPSPHPHPSAHRPEAPARAGVPAQAPL